MLELTVDGEAEWDETHERFRYPNRKVYQLEHSLAALSKWEEKYEKAFLTDQGKTSEEMAYYIVCMIVSPEGVTIDEVMTWSEKDVQTVDAYLAADNSATRFIDHGTRNRRRGPSGEVVTSELMYYWLTVLSIPWEAQYWNLNRLMNLITIANRKNSKQDKASARETAARNRDLNRQRRQELGTKG